MPKKTSGFDSQRKSKGHKEKGTYALYGKNTPKGLRIKQQKLENMQKKQDGEGKLFTYFFSQNNNRG
jgi:hypothetical protein